MSSFARLLPSVSLTLLLAGACTPKLELTAPERGSMLAAGGAAS